MLGLMLVVVVARVHNYGLLVVVTRNVTIYGIFLAV